MNSIEVPTMQVRLVRASQRSYMYFPGVTARRAAELAADASAALCMADVQRMEVFDGPYYGPCGEDETPLLVADWQGMPQLERASDR